MTSNPHEDPTVPGGQVPEPGSEDRTVPSVPKTLPGKAPEVDDKTVPAMSAEALGAGAGPGQLIGKVLGGCRIDKMLGRGAMGAVYKAKQIKLDRDVAVKVIRPEMMTDTRMLKRFEIEARTVGRFNSANVVMVHDVGFEHGVHYLVMEFVQGQNLREHVKLLAGGRLPAGEALALIRQAVKGLDEARRLGVVHRDIKPDNLMLTDQGVLKIADFGIAKPIEADFSMTMTSELIGTPLYMSPEQCQGGAEIDFRSDMYSLGATFFYLLTGEPPIRASSVYELIQTKTKLENLCLWKALPGLDENNPLSRVIERMTANDRDDRYASYEELLNDLVLVEAGETISVKPKRAKPAVAARASGAQAKKGGGGLAAAALVAVLGAAGGGYWWFSRDPAPQPAGGGGGPVVGTPTQPGNDPAIAAAQEALQSLRARLRDDGPSEPLRADVERLQVPASLATARGMLLADLAAGVEAEAKLERSATTKPASVTPPFDALSRYFAAVDAATAPPADAGAELRTWLTARRATARAEAELGPAARAALAAAFGTWQETRKAAAGDGGQFEALRKKLAEIEGARSTLLELFPGQREALDGELPASALAVAGVELALVEIRAQYLVSGPDDSLRTQARGLEKASDAGGGVHKKLWSDLVNEIQRGMDAKGDVAALQVVMPPKPPFDDVVETYDRLNAGLSQVVRVDGELPPWAEALRAEKRAEQQVGPAVVRACEQLWSDWKQRRADGAAADELERRMGTLGEAVQRASELFPAQKEALARAVPQQEIDAAWGTVLLDGKRKQWSADLGLVRQRLDTVRDLAAWRTEKTSLETATKRLGEALAALPDDPEARKRLQALDDACGLWRSAEQRLGEISRRFAASDLSGAVDELRVALGAAEGKSDFERVQVIVDGCRQAFDQLERTLDVPAALAALTAARDRARTFPLMPGEVPSRIETWVAGVEKLGRAASGMVPIAAGMAKQPAQQVDAFFLAATEVSRRDWVAFQRELRAAALGENGQVSFDAVAVRLDGSGMNAQRLTNLLQQPSAGDEDRPVDRLTWFEAMAFCRFYGKDLPTAAEWSLAAFGDGGRVTYPWGDDWTDTDNTKRNTSTQFLVGVADGGLSWRSQGRDAARLHHVAGNVAEWLRAEPADGSADLAGGRFNLRGTASMQGAAAGKLERRRMDDTMSGIGFRPVLRPREFGGLTWPR